MIEGRGTQGSPFGSCAVNEMLGAVLLSSLALGDVTVRVNPKNVTHKVNPLFNGCHSDSGYTHQPRGLYAQMVLGESFEGLGPKPNDGDDALTAGVAAFPIGKTISLAPLSSTNLLIRHCSFQAFVATCPCDADFDFTVVKGLSGVAGSISFRSVNYPAMFLGAVGAGKGEETRATLVKGATPDKASLSWMPEPGLSDKTKFSFKTLSKTAAMAGGYLTSTSKSTGNCAGGVNKGDVVLAKAPTNKADATWETHTHPPPPPPPPPPLSPWGGFSSGTAVGTASIVSTESFHGKDSLSLKMTAGSGIVGMSNRGLGHEGLVFEASKEYQGYFFAKSSKPVTFSVAIVDYVSGNKTLAVQPVHFPGGNWTKLNFTLTPSGATGCVGLDPAKGDPEVDCGKMGPHSHICVKCAGEFAIGLSSPGEANIDYVYLQPGAWGVVAGANPLGGGPALASAASVLKTMGINIIRQGGSFADGSYYYWKNWRGLPWTRESLGAEWGGVGTIISGWVSLALAQVSDKPMTLLTAICALFARVCPRVVSGPLRDDGFLRCSGYRASLYNKCSRPRNSAGHG